MLAFIESMSIMLHLLLTFSKYHASSTDSLYRAILDMTLRALL